MTQGVRKTLNIHWNGSAWTVFPGDPGSIYGGSSLYAVDALSPSDVWAVGVQQNGPYPDTLTMHWDGQQWTTITSPSPGAQYQDVLTGVAAISSSDVWAVGYNFFNGTVQTLTLHWNGVAWTYVLSPNVGSGVNALNGVVASSGSDVWAVGGYVADSQGTVRTLAMRWNGSSWGIAISPNPGSVSSVLYGVTGVSG